MCDKYVKRKYETDEYRIQKKDYPRLKKMENWW